MDNSTHPHLSDQPPPTVAVPAPVPAATSRSEPAERISALSSLLERLDDTRPAEEGFSTELDQHNDLIQVRLGLASSLYMALRAKHEPTASHCLRVALGCSSWCRHLDLSDRERDEIEVAALLHDIGKIGVPDGVLSKPAKLSDDEVAAMERHRHIGVRILLHCCASREILDIVQYAPAWFDGTKDGFDRDGGRLPLGARMVAIIDAYDAMTTDQVYRRAMSRERAMAELYECAGTQFDSDLVKRFGDLLDSEQIKMNAAEARHWLRDLEPTTSNSLWMMAHASAIRGEQTIDSLFHEKLLESMHDGVMFVDTSLQILLWNRAAERLTGVSAKSVQQKRWSPLLILMQDEDNRLMGDADCPVAHALNSGVQTLRRLTVRGRSGDRLSVDAHLVPVVGRDGITHGATLLLHDASSQITLEERVQTLHEKATRDALTQVANRAEFDRVHEQFVETHLERSLSCSLIICDLDHFKQVNDTFGHQAGDEALVCFARLLQRSCRPGDLVARYGGEEFVMLCADCDNATATERAERIRRELADMPQTMLDGRTITASFGVTEIQGGDTPETMLRRADRALLQAKDKGRNMVVQLGTGIPVDASEPRSSWLNWFQRSQTPDQLLERTLFTAVPMSVSVEKLRGFVADHHAEFEAFEDNRITIRIDGYYTPMLRRSGDRPVPFLITLSFDEGNLDVNGRDGKVLRTIIHVHIRPRRNRDRRREDAVERARQLLFSLKSYFMAHEYSGTFDEAPSADTIRKAKRLFGVLRE